jgi:lipoyl-dependent peroxiredoxin
MGAITTNNFILTQKTKKTMSRHATAVWHGSGKEGSGHLTTQSGVLKEAKYSYKARYEDAPGTNPEELIAAAHAGCFTMKLTFVLNAAGFTPDLIETKCDITLADNVITKSHLTVKATVPGIDSQKFNECAANAKTNCPVSKVLNTDISMEATLV